MELALYFDGLNHLGAVLVHGAVHWRVHHLEFLELVIGADEALPLLLAQRLRAGWAYAERLRVHRLDDGLLKNFDKLQVDQKLVDVIDAIFVHDDLLGGSVVHVALELWETSLDHLVQLAQYPLFLITKADGTERFQR